MPATQEKIILQTGRQRLMENNNKRNKKIVFKDGAGHLIRRKSGTDGAPVELQPPMPASEPEKSSVSPLPYKRSRRKKMPREGTFEHFTPDLNKGLTEEQVKLRFKQYLYNDNEKKYSKSYLGIVVQNVCTFFNLLALLVAIALIFSGAEITQFAFALMFALNITIGIIQEIRAKLKIDKLTIITSPTATVVRDGVKREIPVKELVVDDVILLKIGQQIPVDCVMCDGNTEINESLLTGESVPVKKNDGDLLYAGSFVVSGSCRARVRFVGKETYANKLTAKAQKYKRPHSEIMNSTNLFIRIIAVLMIPIAVGIFYMNYFAKDILNPDLAEAIQKTCAVIVGMIPSGMIFLTSAAMAMGILRLSKNHTLVQDMYSLEMLARVDVLCLDKTGTITDGRMQVSEVTVLSNPTDYTVDAIVSSMEAALDDNNQTAIALCEKFGRNAVMQPKTVIPFSSVRKFSAVAFQGVGTFALGAPEFVLSVMPPRLEKAVQKYAQRGLRVLLLAYSSAMINGERLPSVFRPLALIALSDNIRADAPATIAWFKENDVKIKVISGDNPLTVSEVARRAGVPDADKYVSLEGLSNPEVESAAENYTVFGRVTPEQKAILIKALKKQDHTVAMTGDGVNDILAMKESDCAISIAAGSQAASQVSNLVLTDNNFANMPKVVYEGRRLINNVKNTSSLYIMKTLFTAIIAVICICMGTQYLFKTNNLLCFELLVAGIPSIILSQQPNGGRVEGKYFSYVLFHALPAAITMAAAVMTVYIASLLQFGEFTPTYQALSVLALTFSGLVMLYRLCQPFNILRAVTFASSAAICALIFAVPVLGNIIVSGWSGIHFSLAEVLLLLCILEAAFAVSKWLLGAFGWVREHLANKV